MRHVQLRTPPILEPLVVEFRHPPLAIQFGFELAPGLTSPDELCRRVNQGLSRVLPQARLLDWDSTKQTARVRLRLEQSLLMDQGPVFDWFDQLAGGGGGGLASEALLSEWPEPLGDTEVWSAPDWNPSPGSMVGRLTANQVKPLMMTTTTTTNQGINIRRPEKVHLRLLLPAAGSLSSIDMSGHPFNAFFRTDPANICFQEHLAVRMADLLARPPLLADQFGVCWTNRVESSEARVVWNGDLPSPVWNVSLRLSTFWQNYLLPTAAGSLTRVSLTELAKFRPRRQGDVSVAATLAPYPNPGQSLFPSPLALCSDALLGDTFLNPRWSYPCLSLIVPSGDEFRLAHAPFLRLEGIEGLGPNISLYLLDSQGRRVLPGPESRVWVELSSF